MKHKFNRVRQVAPMCPHGTADWRDAANVTEPSVCGSDVVFFKVLQICVYCIDCCSLLCGNVTVFLGYIAVLRT